MWEWVDLDMISLKSSCLWGLVCGFTSVQGSSYIDLPALCFWRVGVTRFSFCGEGFVVLGWPLLAIWELGIWVPHVHGGWDLECVTTGGVQDGDGGWVSSRRPSF